MTNTTLEAVKSFFNFFISLCDLHIAIYYIAISICIFDESFTQLLPALNRLLVTSAER